LEGSLPVYLISLGVLIAFSAFFSGSEAALFSLRRTQISRMRTSSAAGGLVAKLLAEPRSLLITILIGNLVVNVFAASAATALAITLFGEKGIAIAFAFMSTVIIVFGEILPKVFAVNRPGSSARLMVYPLRVFHALFLPLRAPIAKLTDTVIGSLTKQLGTVKSSFSSAELLTAVDIGHRQGHLEDFEHKLLSNIIEFRDTVVKEIMTPSIDVFSLPASMRPEEMVEEMLKRDISRVPVYGDTPDDIKGVAHIKDLALVREAGDADSDLKLREPYYVPESTRIAGLFKELGRRRTQLALVIDEYGSYVGIVTLEDILEELVGEIRDEKEAVTESYTLLDDGRIVVLGSMNIDDFNDVFGVDIIDERNETIAGYVLAETGEIPREGETIEVDDLRFHIISAQPNRIRKMRVEKK